MERLQLTDEAIERVETLVALDSTAAALRAALDALPAEQRAAVQARVVEETPYADIASATLVHEATVRQRVSRGLAGLRARLDRGAT
ncbi:MAG: sigma-70 region 4 domain-containing protein [Actinomycetota bacterium]|nr:sigma-70 region 4 domain-containing protein [Actinomycetota bacterium]